MKFIDTPTRNLFFTGKGGVGKTSVACATPPSLAERGRTVLLVSTDPASNIDEVLGVHLGTAPTPIPQVPGLSALNLDPEAAAAEYRESVIGPYREALPASAIKSMEEQLSGACTVEIAAFDAFAKLLGDAEATRTFDHVVFDTAPTGHTLRLLALPKAWTGFMDSNTTGATCLGPLEGLGAQRALYRRTVDALADRARTALVLVTRPERAALDEAARSSAELQALGVANQHLVVNGVFRAEHADDVIAVALEARGRAALDALPAALAGLPRVELALSLAPPIGVEALRYLLDRSRPVPAPAHEDAAHVPLPPGLDTLLAELERHGRGVILTMGTGGVGKTTVAARLALALARRGHRVLLTTTDPAAHVAGAVGALPPGLEIDRIDPAAEVEHYRAEVMATAGAELDADGRALLEEEMNSPCSEEIAVFQAFARTVGQAQDRFVVLDTAPTGHTILLLDAAEAYHREVLRRGSGASDAVLNLLPRLRDPAFTRVLICTLPEATPVHEAAALQADLRRAGIEPCAWVINQSLAPLTLTDPVLVHRQAQERHYIREVVEQHAARAALLPWSTAPVGAATEIPAKVAAPA
jgi:arsenite/tail-anchored protein-transporting ATPase